jgi:hypothetical protein
MAARGLLSLSSCVLLLLFILVVVAELVLF